MKKKIVIYGSGRSGTTLLGSFLAAHPAIDWAGEVLNYQRWQSWPACLAYRLIKRYPATYLQWCAYRSGKPAYASKLLTYQSAGLHQTIAHLQRQDWCIIYLYRRSLFQRLLSAEVAKLTGRWHSNQSIEPEMIEPEMIEPVLIPVESFLEKLKRSYHVCELELATVSTVPHLTFCYEDDLADPAAWPQTIQKLLEYIGLALIPAQTQTERTWARPYEEMVANYQDLLAAAQHAHLYYHALYEQAS